MNSYSGLAKMTGLTEYEIGNIMKEKEEREKAQRRAAQMQWVMNKSNFNPATIGGFMLGGILGDSINRWLDRSGGDPRKKLANVNTSNMTPEQKLDWNNYLAGGKPFEGLFGNLDALEKKKTQEEMKTIRYFI